jgi:acyl-CoA reductase-like NAD-dependent aldehyde dehydrogenase
MADEFFSRPEVRTVNFTGSSATERILAERAGRTLKRCVLELGGYNPLIVVADADLDYAVETAAFAAFFHAAGARVLVGGSTDGSCYRPTILVDAPDGASIHSEETFGPILVAQPVVDADEVLAIANSTRYGLSAGLISGDSQRGFALAPDRRRGGSRQRPDHRR